MRSLLLFALLLAIIPTGIEAGEAGVRVLDEKNGEIRVRISPPSEDGVPLPMSRFYVVVPSSGTVSVERVGGSFTTRPIVEDERGVLNIYKENLDSASTGSPGWLG